MTYTNCATSLSYRRLPKLEKILQVDESRACADLYEKIADFIWKKKELMTGFYRQNDSSFAREMIRVGESLYLEIWKAKRPDMEVTEEVLYLVSYHMAGFQGMMRRWLESDFDISRDRFGQMLQAAEKVFVRGVQGV